MEHQKIIKLLENTPSKPSKFRTKNQVEINDYSRGTYSGNSQIKLYVKVLKLLKLSQCDYIDAFIPVKGTITVLNTVAEGADVNNIGKKNNI